MLIKNMRIAIDLTALYNRKWTGVELYAIDLYKALLNLKYNVIPIFHVQNEIDENANAYIIDESNRIILENIFLSRAVRSIKADITLFPIFPPPVDLYINKCTKIVPVIHDTAFLEFRDTLKFAAKYYLTPKSNIALKMADFIVTISETEKKKLAKFTKLPIVNWTENISCDFCPENIVIDNSLLDQFNLRPVEYYISVSTIEPRKNLIYLLKIIRKELHVSGKKLVLVGRNGWGKDAELDQLIKEMNNQIVFTEYVSLATLQTLYHYAYAFALMSIDEGFGRTPLEAIACGCKKIIVSDIEIFHETLGNSGNYLPLYDEEFASNVFLNEKWQEVARDFELPLNFMEKKIKCFFEFE